MLFMYFLTLVPPRIIREDGSGDVDNELDNRLTDAVLSGERIHITCHVTADPPPQITWYKNGQELRIESLDDRLGFLVVCVCV